MMLIVIEGLDASGKETQTNLLYKNLKTVHDNVRKVSFPDYKSDSSALVKMYLNGDFGKSADDVSPYIASTFFAADRYASFKKDWEKDYRDGCIILADRYVTANMLHQASKLEKPEEKEVFLNWLADFEYRLYGLPQPDLAFFLNVPPGVSRKLMESRSNKFTKQEEKDIHEKDSHYLEKTYQNALFVIQRYPFIEINCVTEDNQMRTIEEIQQEILTHVNRKLKEV